MTNKNIPEDILAFSQKWVSVVFGGLATFFLTPPFYDFSGSWIGDFTMRNYDASFVWPIQIVWWFTGAGTIFFTACAFSIATLRIIFAKFFGRFF